MAYATPRRPSAIPELASPSPSFSRRVSTASSLGGGGQSGSPSLGSGSERKRRTRLRDYYGLSTPRPGDGMDLDSPASFDANNYFQTLASTASLPELLKRETDLINEIRELDGERQSLVYNHHGELISASDTIRKMKSRAEALDTSLDSLKSSFQTIAQLSASLAPTTASSASAKPPSSAPTYPRSPTEPPHTPRSSRRLAALPESPDSPTTPTQSRARSASQPPPPEAIRPFSGEKAKATVFGGAPG
ncbi:RHTO0S01e08416g1_1 [Rhodotorula toruloides]|uniref:Vacuolar protein sorting-associated protein 51 homolog n=1 Tax=Rhodotorula toruloides TaxID=5286 RepID=A0A061AKK9_RHOTO|nr:RHTO0S01e08416g1_1 [Rhodotorula toruloides]